MLVSMENRILFQVLRRLPRDLLFSFAKKEGKKRFVPPMHPTFPPQPVEERPTHLVPSQPSQKFLCRKGLTIEEERTEELI